MTNLIHAAKQILEQFDKFEIKDLSLAQYAARENLRDALYVGVPEHERQTACKAQAEYDAIRARGEIR